jgi:6-pyruvoyltetrahydropterin/6-carboxytetrahydropterin synthase
MTRIRITKEFTFDMAHALWNYDGLCRNIHGHTYRLAVTLIGEPSTDSSSPKLGMVIDFSDLKDIVKKPVVERFDHALVLHRTHHLSALLAPAVTHDKIILVDYQPTCENLLVDFVTIIKRNLPGEVTLHSVKLHETPTSYAEWFASDND